jgi:antibiotic biosynthesis monooxygenase (ABM) superfamily enzyme
MSLLTWIAVWLASMLMRAILAPVLGPKIPQVLDAGLVAGVVVVILTWAAMPFLVNLAHPWLHPKSKARNAHKTHRPARANLWLHSDTMLWHLVSMLQPRSHRDR